MGIFLYLYEQNIRLLLTELTNITKIGGGSHDRSHQQKHHTTWVAGLMIHAWIQISTRSCIQKQEKDHICSMWGLPLLWKAMTSRGMKQPCEIMYVTWIFSMCTCASIISLINWEISNINWKGILLFCSLWK